MQQFIRKVVGLECVTRLPGKRSSRSRPIVRRRRAELSIKEHASNLFSKRTFEFEDFDECNGEDFKEPLQMLDVNRIMNNPSALHQELQPRGGAPPGPSRRSMLHHLPRRRSQAGFGQEEPQKGDRDQDLAPAPQHHQQPHEDHLLQEAPLSGNENLRPKRRPMRALHGVFSEAVIGGRETALESPLTPSRKSRFVT